MFAVPAIVFFQPFIFQSFFSLFSLFSAFYKRLKSWFLLCLPLCFSAFYFQSFFSRFQPFFNLFQSFSAFYKKLKSWFLLCLPLCFFSLLFFSLCSVFFSAFCFRLVLWLGALRLVLGNSITIKNTNFNKKSRWLELCGWCLGAQLQLKTPILIRNPGQARSGQVRSGQVCGFDYWY